MTVRPSDSVLIANGDGPQNAGKFELSSVGGNRFCLAAVYPKQPNEIRCFTKDKEDPEIRCYTAADGSLPADRQWTLRADRSRIDAWEVFVVTTL